MIPQYKNYRVGARHPGIKHGAQVFQTVRAKSALGAMRIVAASDKLEGRKMDYKVKMMRDS